MIIFELLLTTFEVSINFRASWANNEKQLEPKTLPPYPSLSTISLYKCLIHSVAFISNFCFSL